MPIYEYRCSSCGHELEALQKFSDAPLSTCPSCQRDALTKKVSLAGFQLKGSGWYVTDFRDKSSGKKDGAKTETATDSKPESGGTSPAPAKEGSPAPAPAADSTPAKSPPPPPPSSGGTS
jgi:putative FmdB family regulatory protein